MVNEPLIPSIPNKPRGSEITEESEDFETDSEATGVSMERCGSLKKSSNSKLMEKHQKINKTEKLPKKNHRIRNIID